MAQHVEINDEVAFWIEQGAIHLRAVSKPVAGDPVELSLDEAERICTELGKMIESIRAENS